MLQVILLPILNVSHYHTKNHINSYHGSTTQDKFKIWVNRQFKHVGSYLGCQPLTEIIKIATIGLTYIQNRENRTSINLDQLHLQHDVSQFGC